MRLPELKATLRLRPERWRLDFDCGHGVELLLPVERAWRGADQAAWVRRHYPTCPECAAARRSRPPLRRWPRPVASRPLLIA